LFNWSATVWKSVFRQGEFRDMLPKSKVGKILRRELREEERKKQEE
jgi:acyl-coenzyme A synthetase/AMP-(fatty) acid ligase